MIPVSWRYEYQLDYITVENGFFINDGRSLMPRKDWMSPGMNGDHIPITIGPRRSFRTASGDPYRQTSRWSPAIYNGKNGGSNRRVDFH